MPWNGEPLSNPLPHPTVERAAYTAVDTCPTAASTSAEKDQVGLAPVSANGRGVDKASAINGIADSLETDHEPAEWREAN